MQSVAPLMWLWRYVWQVNKAEAEFWRRNAGSRVGWSDEILGVDCGGQQCVMEVRATTCLLHTQGIETVMLTLQRTTRK